MDAFRRQPLRNRQPDAGGGARDQSGLSLELQIHVENLLFTYLERI
jgi:hypothetical protein